MYIYMYMYFILIQINSKTSNLEKTNKTNFKKKQQQKLVIFVIYKEFNLHTFFLEFLLFLIFGGWF